MSKTTNRYPPTCASVPFAWFRDALLNEALFSKLGQTRQQIRDWQHDYHYHRPRSGLGNTTPAEFMVRKGPEMRAA